MDVQYERTLVETGIVGLAVFLWLAWSALKSSLAAFRALRDPEERGLALGFLAGTIGLLVHAVGANTFIIVRIMEPSCFSPRGALAYRRSRRARRGPPPARRSSASPGATGRRRPARPAGPGPRCAASGAR